MAVSYKQLGQGNPGAVLTDLYTVPAATEGIVSSVVACNRSAVAKTFRVSVAVAGASDDPEQYYVYDRSIPANDTTIVQIGISLAATDVVRVYASTTDVSFSINGMEIT